LETDKSESLARMCLAAWIKVLPFHRMHLSKHGCHPIDVSVKSSIA
jgi:hypothetical protein